MEEDDLTKWYLNMSYSSGPGRTAFPLREPYADEAAARAAYRGYATEAISHGGKVVAAWLEPPNGAENITIIRRRTP